MNKVEVILTTTHPVVNVYEFDIKQPDKIKLLLSTYPTVDAKKFFDQKKAEQDALNAAEANDILDALVLMNRHWNDIMTSNPGLLGRIYLQDFSLMNEALIKSEKILKPRGLMPTLKKKGTK